MNAANAGHPLIRLDNVTVGYDRHPALHHLSLQVPAGDMLAVIGPNGAGKSTFLKLLTGELQPMDGRAWLPAEQVCRIAYLPQLNQTDRQFPITVQDLVASGLWHRCGAFGGLGRAERRLIDEALGVVGLRGYARRVLGALSGGEFQRVRFAQLMLQNAGIVILDEPFVGIDVTTIEALLQLLACWHAQGTTIIAALHEQDIVRDWFPRTLLLAREMIAIGPTGQVLTPGNWRHAVNRSMAAREPGGDWCARSMAEAAGTVGESALGTIPPAAGPAAAGQIMAEGRAAGEAASLPGVSGSTAAPARPAGSGIVHRV